MQGVLSAWLQAVAMPRVKWFSVPFATAQTPVEQHWYCIDDATIASTADLAGVVLAQAQLPSTTKLFLQTESGWREISTLAEVPGGDLVVKAVEGRVRRTQDNTPGQKPDRQDHSGLHHWRQARCRRDSDSARAWQLNVISAASLVCHILHKGC